MFPSLFVSTFRCITVSSFDVEAGESRRRVVEERRYKARWHWSATSLLGRSFSCRTGLGVERGARNRKARPESNDREVTGLVQSSPRRTARFVVNLSGQWLDAINLSVRSVGHEKIDARNAWLRDWFKYDFDPTHTPSRFVSCTSLTTIDTLNRVKRFFFPDRGLYI